MITSRIKIYLMEAVCLGIFMVSASVFSTLLDYPASLAHQSISSPFVRRILMGLAMGTTATLLIYSPMGKLSGAHMNPAVSLSFLRLGKITLRDALFYMLFQCLGGVFAIWCMVKLIGEPFVHPSVNYVQTLPGIFGIWGAFAIEALIAFAMMTMVLTTSNHPRLSNFTGYIAGFMVASYVVLTGPISGFSMNPARTLASAIPAMNFESLWIYLTAPFAGMLLATELFRYRGGKAVCAKLRHVDSYLCIFNCGYCTHQHHD